MQIVGPDCVNLPLVRASGLSLCKLVFVKLCEMLHGSLCTITLNYAERKKDLARSFPALGPSENRAQQENYTLDSPAAHSYVSYAL